MTTLDLHVHTEYSSDGLMSLSRLVQICKKRGLGNIAVTDHNSVEGALRLASMGDALEGLGVIVGEEIRTNDGEVIGLFLKEEVPRSLPMERTIELIREQGGLVYLPHPCDRLRRSKIRPEILRDIMPLVDIVEVFNARNVFQPDNDAAMLLTEEFGKAKGVGSDSHTVMEMGNCYQELEDFDPFAPNPQADFLAKLRDARLVTRKSSLLVHGITKTVKIMNSISGNGEGKPDKPNVSE